jgi:hypothetical protein
VHHERCQLRTAGQHAMPHNRGRRFWRCPRWASQDCTWVWEDGSLPFSEASHARFDEWADSIGGGPLCIFAHMLGSSCGDECDEAEGDEGNGAAE